MGVFGPPDLKPTVRFPGLGPSDVDQSSAVSLPRQVQTLGLVSLYTQMNQFLTMNLSRSLSLSPSSYPTLI